MDLRLSGSRALVTGGSRGIGLSVAHALSLEGAHVGILGRDADALTAAARSVGPGTATVQADTTDDTAVRSAVDRVAHELGGLDVVVNAAAAPSRPGQSRGLAGVDDEDLLRQVDIKALGYVRVVRAAAPHLESGGGRVVNIGGMNARATGSITGSVRNIAVVAISKSLADELGPRGVTVTCVHPGMTVTEAVAHDETFLESASHNAIGRPVAADEVANVVAFLASPLATIVNGAVVTVDGGRPGAIWA